MVTFIDDYGAKYGGEPICTQLPIAPLTYCTCKARQADHARLPERVRRDAELVQEIRRVHEADFRVYGVRKVWRQLGHENVAAARCTAERLKKSLGLKGVLRVRRCRMTIVDESADRSLDQVNRQCKASRPNELWVADFTYVATWSGFVRKAKGHPAERLFRIAGSAS